MIDPSNNGVANTSINKLLSVTSEKETAKRAINQLVSVVTGSGCHEDLKVAPKLRIKKCIEVAMGEYSEASSMLQDCVPDARRMVATAQRKLDSLNSLAVLANIVDEI